MLFRSGDEVTFLHRVAPGASSASYGIEVARMAGVPETVVDRARAVVESADATDAGGEDATESTPDPTPTEPDAPADARSKPTDDSTPNEPGSEQTETVDDRTSYPEEAFEADASDDRASYPDEAFFDGTPDPAVDEPLDEESMVRVAVALRSVDVASMTPLEALNTLDELRSELR